MYTNKGNNSKDKKDTSVNTKGFQFFNKEGIDPSTLIVSYWNEGIVLKIHPTLPKDKQDNEHVFDYDHSLSTIVNARQAKLLLLAFPKFEEAMNDSLEYSTGIRIGISSVLVLSTGVKETGALRPYIGIYKDINAETLEATSGIRYEFNVLETIEDYDPRGCKLQTETYHVELMLFMAALKTVIEAFTHAHTHSHRNVQRYFNSKLSENIDLIIANLGYPKTSFKFKDRNTVKTENGTFNINKSQSGMTNAYNKLDDAKVYHGTIDDMDDLPF